ncbi:MAG: signal peptidase I [Clostridia bacterium]|nr:signal peptidase I [Clostridia bacterium]
MSMNKSKAVVFSWLKQIILIILLTLFISIFIIQTYDISDVSMEPTFDQQGNRVLVFLTPYHFGIKPGYGEIVIIDSRVDRKRILWDRLIESPLVALLVRERNVHMWVKRVIGLPGDILEYKDGRVYRNGQELTEPYIMDEMKTAFETAVIPEGFIYVMGDNRNRSSDSRIIGPVPISNIQGRVILRFYPFNKMSAY